MPFAYLCDFDGTISPRDIGAALVRKFSTAREAEREELLARWAEGGLGHRELTRRECALVTVTAEDALAYARTFKLDPHFAPFVREALGRGDAVMVVSEGFDFYVRDHLQRAGFPDLPWAANAARFEGATLVPEFPFADPACESCGNCKAQHVRRYRGRGFHTVLVGDGLSDRCGARAADSVLASGQLRAWCRAEGVGYHPFDHFGDVAEFARRQDLAAPLPRPSREPARPAPRA
jgi:2,3-diketo-5-methylthio-1-phosphopentane phosphatase